MNDIDPILSLMDFEKLSNDDGAQFTDILNNIRWTDKSIDDLREAQKKLNKFGISLTKANMENRFCVLLIAHLIKEERNRPLEEQFPFVRNDVDKLLKSTMELNNSTIELNNYNQDQSNELESLIKDGLVYELSSQGWEVNDIGFYFPNGKIKKKDKKDLVQWDAIVEAVKKSDEADALVECRLYLVETKETPHENDIIGEPDNEKSIKKSLLTRGVQTIEFLKEIDTQLKGDTKREFQTQCAILKPLQSHSIVLCYASRHITDGVKDKLKTLKDDLQNKYKNDCITVNALEFATRLKVSEIK